MPLEQTGSSVAVVSHDAPPRVPTIRIRPSRGIARINFDELLAYRELLFFLIWRDVKIRYTQTILGIAWAVIQPLFTMLMFTLLFGRLARMPSDGIAYPLFAYSGLLLWTFLSTAIANSSASLVGSSNLISKVYFPRLLIPASTVGAALVDLGIAFVCLFGLMAFYGVGVSPRLVLLPIFVLLTALLALGTGLWLAAMNVRYRDIRHAVPFALQLWMFGSPIIYPSSLVPPRFRLLLAANPLTGIIEGFRACLFDRPLDAPAVGISALVTVVVLLSALVHFQKVEKSFADVI